LDRASAGSGGGAPALAVAATPAAAAALGTLDHHPHIGAGDLYFILWAITQMSASVKGFGCRHIVTYPPY
jgi:hypothetical protein